MGKLIYSMNVSLDGYLSDTSGNFEWAEPKEDVHRYINDIEAKNEIIIYGKRMYEILAAWENIENIEIYPDYIRDYDKIWKSKKKVVYSRSLKECKTKNTIVKSIFIADEIRRMKKDTQGNIGIGGANIASQAIDMALVDEINLFIFSSIVGNGTKWISNLHLKKLKLLEIEKFNNDVVLLHYSVI